MSDYPSAVLYSVRFLFVGLVLAAGLFLLSLVLSSIEMSSVQAKSRSSSAYAPATSMSSSPNVVTSGMARMGYGLGQALDSTTHVINGAAVSATSTVAHSGKLVANGVLTGATATARGVGSGLAFVGRAVGKGVGAVISIPRNVLGFVSNAPVVRSVIRPSDHVEIPIIDPDSPELHAALAALPPTQTAQPAPAQGETGPVWPMHGEVTTEFGVDHWPYQHTHTGIDISDGRASGVTPIKPFRPGRVIKVIHSNKGLGNHVIVDHGNGVTSVYAHLSSTSVQVGQEVALGTTLGLEGTTGVSTGTHLHFEVRVNGQAANPRQFIGGNP